MTARYVFPLNLSSARGGEPRADEGTTPAEQHWLAAAAAVTGGGTERERVAAVARGLGAAEEAGRDDVRFGSAFCPDCGEHCDRPHRGDCPLVEDGPDPDVCAHCDHQRAFHHHRHDGICIGGCNANCTSFKESTR